MSDSARERWTAFVDAAQLNRELADEMLAAEPGLLEMPGVLGETPLHFLALEAFADGVRYLISKGANVNCVNEFGNSALQEVAGIAPALGSTELVSLLLDAGADPYHYSETHSCAWHAAGSSKNSQLRELFDRFPSPSKTHELCDIIN